MIKPYGDNVLVKMEERDRMTKGGIHVPDTAESEFGDGVVAAKVLRTGPGMWGRNMGYEEQASMGVLDRLSTTEHVPQLDKKRAMVRERQKIHKFDMDVKPGDRVLLDKMAGDPLVVGENLPPRLAEEFSAGEELRIVRCAEIMGVLE